jgi:hypothetical protein
MPNVSHGKRCGTDLPIPPAVLIALAHPDGVGHQPLLHAQFLHHLPMVC